MEMEPIVGCGVMTGMAKGGESRNSIDVEMRMNDHEE